MHSRFFNFGNKNEINAAAQSVDIFNGRHVFGAKKLEQNIILKQV